ncbi:MAG TPA: phage tail protein [Planctomycetota bacterium]|nr:phage tail protein [Planctomycetota bacterium]
MPENTAATGAPGTMGAVPDPYRAYNFKLDIGGDTAGHFTDVGGLGARVESIAYRQGGEHQVVHRLPGRVEYYDVVLRYGLTSSRTLWQWFQTGLRGAVQRKNVSIILLDNAGEREVMRWNLQGAWIKEWKAAALDAQGRELAVESLTLCYETLELA